jgi:hypothetical protein
MAELDKNKFDADAIMLENTSRQIMIGGKVWHPAKRTGNVAKRIARLGDPPESDGTPESVEKAMDYLYANLALMLVDGNGEHPNAEWLLDEVEWNVANDMLGFLNPEAADAMKEAIASPPTPAPLRPVQSPLTEVLTSAERSTTISSETNQPLATTS